LAVFLLIPADRAPSWPLLAVFVLLQAARIWVVATLGPYWTTRVLSLPGAPLVRRGPYRWVRHPNYLIVTAEIAVLPLAFDAWAIAIAFSLANALLLYHRIGIEEGALAGRG
jgi:methyltransferase